MSSLAIEGIYLKPYAACRHCHPAIEAAICLRENHNLDYESVAAVRVITYDLAVFGHDHSDVRGIASAKMSIPFGVALALKFGKAGMNEFSNQTIEDNELLQLSQRVEVLPSEELSNLVPDKRGAIVEVDMESGNTYSYRSIFQRVSQRIHLLMQNSIKNS